MQNLTPRYNTRKQRSLSCFCMVRGYSSTRTYVTLWGRAVLGDRGGSSVRVRCACTNNRARESLIRVLYWSPLHLEDLLGDVVPEQLVSVAIRVQPRHGTAICVCRPAQEAHQTKYESDDAHSHILLGTGQRRAHPLQAERNWNGAVHNLRTSSAVSVSWPSLQPTQGEHNVMTNRCHKQQVCRPNGEARTLEYISAACASSCATQSSMLCLRTLPLIP